MSNDAVFKSIQQEQQHKRLNQKYKYNYTYQVEAIVGYANNEPVQLESRNERISVLRVSDYIDMVANGIITNESTIENEPELVSGFVSCKYSSSVAA